MIYATVPAGSIQVGEDLTLDSESAHHLKVRRVREATEGRVLDGHGAVGMGCFHPEGSDWAFRVDLVVMQPKPAETVLAVGAGDRDRFLLLAEKVAELGVTRLIPLATSETRSVENRVRGSVVEKARKRAAEACKQSGNAWLPTIDQVRPLAELATLMPQMKWLLAHPRGGSLPSIIAHEPVGWLIGPEAGFNSDDLAVIDKQLAPTPVALGQHVMRFETAAIAAAVLTDVTRMDQVRYRRS
jgi:16S rRNA (uracil1498-N3)-methyltransferase